MNTKRLIINSKNRDTTLSKSGTDFVISFQESISLQNVSKISVESISMSNLVYNVNETNNEVRWTEGGGAIHIVQMEVGQYVLVDYMTALEALFNSIGSNTFNVTQNPVNKKLIIDNPNTAFVVQSNGSMNRVIGLSSENNSPSVGVNNILNAPFTLDLGGADMLFLHSRKISEYNSINSNGPSSVLTYISFSETSFGGFCTREPNDENFESIEYTVPVNLGGNIDFKVRDISGNIIDLQNSHVILILRCYLVE